MNKGFRFNLPEFFTHMEKKDFEQEVLERMKTDFLKIMREIWELGRKVTERQLGEKTRTSFVLSQSDSCIWVDAYSVLPDNIKSVLIADTQKLEGTKSKDEEDESSLEIAKIVRACSKKDAVLDWKEFYKQVQEAQLTKTELLSVYFENIDILVQLEVLKALIADQIKKALLCQTVQELKEVLNYED